MTAKQSKKLETYVRNFVYKSVQVLVQGRQNQRLRTDSKPVASGSDWFNLGIVDIPEVHAEAKRLLLPPHALSPGPIINVEVSLKTEEGTMVIEVWTISLSGSSMPAVEPPASLLAKVYSELGMLLRSLCVASRLLPGYLCARQQSHTSHSVVCRLYGGEAVITQMDQRHKCLRLGSVSMMSTVGGVAHEATAGVGGSSALVVSVAYCTRMEMAPLAGPLTGSLMEPKQNHFDETNIQLTVKFSGSHMDTHDGAHSPIGSGCDVSACRTSCTAESEGRHTPVMTSPAGPDARVRKRSGAFAPQSGALDEDGCDGVLFGSLLYMSQLDTEVESQGYFCPDTGEQPAAITSCDEMEQVETSEKDDDFIMIQLKTPFAPSADAESDLGRFFRSCQHMPDLQMFHRGPAVRETLENIADDLSQFESSLPDFDEFVCGLQQLSETATHGVCRN